MTDAEKLALIEKHHYITAMDAGDDSTIDICAECGSDYPCFTIETIRS